MKRFLIAAVMILLFAVNVFSQTVPVETGVLTTVTELDRPLLDRQSELAPMWRNVTQVDTLRLPTSGDADTSIAYISFEQCALILFAAQANDSTSVKVRLYAGTCEDDSTRTVLLVDSVDFSAGVNPADGTWKDDSTGVYIWHHNVFLSSHFFYVITTNADSGTDIKIYDSYVIRRRNREESWELRVRN